MSDPMVSGKMLDPQANQWAMILHLSLLGGYVVPLLGLIAPILIWQLKKDQFPILDEHGRNATNWIISSLIYGMISGVLVLVMVGFVLLFALAVVSIVFPVIAAIKANDGIVWKYPLAIRFV